MVSPCLYVTVEGVFFLQREFPNRQGGGHMSFLHPSIHKLVTEGQSTLSGCKWDFRFLNLPAPRPSRRLCNDLTTSQDR